MATAKATRPASVSVATTAIAAAATTFSTTTSTLTQLPSNNITAWTWQLPTAGSNLISSSVQVALHFYLGFFFPPYFESRSTVLSCDDHRQHWNRPLWNDDLNSDFATFPLLCFLDSQTSQWVTNSHTVPTSAFGFLFFTTDPTIIIPIPINIINSSTTSYQFAHLGNIQPTIRSSTPRSSPPSPSPSFP